MAVVLGNLALLVDVASVSRIPATERKPRPPATAAIEVLLSLSKREIVNPYASLSAKAFESDGEVRSHKAVARGKGNSRAKAVDFDAGSSDEEGSGNGNGNDNGNGGYGEELDWEAQMGKRMKEIEAMRELEKAADELQSLAAAEGGGGGDEVKEETEEEKRMRVRKELEKVAKEQAERRASAELMFELGQKAYGKGMYGRAIEFLEGSLTIIPRTTLFGGEIQIWLAMAYEANNRHKDCIALYRWLEKQHPCFSIRRQAADLRYILQAPRLKISQEEMVTIPLIGNSYDSYAVTWSDKYKDKDESLSGSITNQFPSSRDYLGDFLVWRPPVGLEKNRAFWVAVTVWLSLVGAALVLQR